MSHDEFAGANACASYTYPVKCSSLRKGGYVILNNRPCKIVEISTAKPGKHGHAKIRMVGLDLFTKRKYEGLSPSTHNVDVPNVSKRDFQVIDLSDGELSLLDDSGNLHRDIALPVDETLKLRIRDKFANEDDFLVTVLIAMGEGIVIGMKEKNTKK